MLTASAGLLAVVPEGWFAYADALQYAPIAVLAVILLWLISKRISRKPEAAEIVSAAPLSPSPPMVEPGASPVPRARFVPMNFAVPDAIAPPISAGSPPQWDNPPLTMECQPLRLTLTLRHAALRYCLRLGNRGAQALGPLIVRADLATTAPDIPPDRQAAFDPDLLPLCHYLDRLPTGDDAELTGELRLPLAEIAAIRLGPAKLLVPLMRVWVQTAGDTRPALSCAECFAIGVPPITGGGSMQPLHLDAGLGIWRKLTARRLQSANLLE